jgi:hypothetical protein
MVRPRCELGNFGALAERFAREGETTVMLGRFTSCFAHPFEHRRRTETQQDDLLVH